MKRHKWINDRCVNCLRERKRKSWKRLMAITNHPPYDHYQYGTAMAYLVNDRWTFKRPDCDSQKHL